MENLQEIGDFEFEAYFGHFFNEESCFEEVTSQEIQNVEENKKKVNERTFRTVNVDQFLETSVNKNTKKKTDSDMKYFNLFLQSKNELRLPEFIPPDTLNTYICEFLLGASKPDGKEYEPTTLRGYVSSIDRYLKSKNSKLSIINDVEFCKARMVLKGKQKQLKSLGYGNKPKTAEPLQEEHLNTMYECKTLGDDNPRALIHSLWLVCTTYFGMRTGQEIHNLRWGDIKLEIDDQTGEEYLILDTERQTKTRTGVNPKDTRLFKPKAFSTPGNPQRDPVHLYKFYGLKRPIGTNAEDSPFFLVPGSCQQKCWFRKTPMGINKIYSIMKEMKEDAGIEAPRITPYSARKRLIQKLSDDGVPANHIVQISGHKNVNSLNNYSKLNNAQSRNISNILSDTASTSNSAIAPISSASGQQNTPPTFMSEGAASRGFFTNSHFHGNVTFNFNTSSTSTQQLSQQVINSKAGIESEDNSPLHRNTYKRIRMIPDSDSD